MLLVGCKRKRKTGFVSVCVYVTMSNTLPFATILKFCLLKKKKLTTSKLKNKLVFNNMFKLTLRLYIAIIAQNRFLSIQTHSVFEILAYMHFLRNALLMFYINLII